MDITLRRETPEDYQAVECLTREAFWNLHSPGCCEHYLIHVLRESPDFIRELDFVAESGGRVVGHTAYTKSAVMGRGAILILGDPAYYSRVGFVPAENYGIRYGEKFAAALQACELRPGALADCPGVFMKVRYST